MKYILFLILGLLPTFALGQSLITLENGKVLTISSDGYYYDGGNFILPYKIKHVGGNYIVDGKKSFNTVDENGIYYKLGNQKLPKILTHTAENYILTRFGRIFTVNKNGVVYRGQRDKVFKKVKIHGGKFFVSEKKKGQFELIVINENGIILNVKVPNLDPSTIAQTGSNYFVTTSGELFTIDNQGFVYSKKDLGLSFTGFMEKGGNFFFYRNKLYTVSSTGVLLEQDQKLITANKRFMGTNFIITDDQMIHIIDKDGSVKSSYFNFKISEVSQISKYE